MPRGGGQAFECEDEKWGGKRGANGALGSDDEESPRRHVTVAEPEGNQSGGV